MNVKYLTRAKKASVADSCPVEVEEEARGVRIRQGGLVVGNENEQSSAGVIHATGEETGLRELDVCARDEEERTPLHGAAAEGLQETVAALIGRHADVNAQDRYGSTPLHIAARNGFGEVTAMLIKSGASVTKKDSSGLTALDYARARNHSQTARLLEDAQELQSNSRSRQR
jgi:hypothetical protein